MPIRMNAQTVLYITHFVHKTFVYLGTNMHSITG